MRKFLSTLFASVLAVCLLGPVLAEESQPAAKSAIAQHWESLGKQKQTALGDPVSPEVPTADGRGKLRVYRSGAIYDHPAIGQLALWGELWRKYDAMGRERSVLGLPTSGTVQTTDYVGEHAYFQNGVMYWSRKTGAHWIGSGPLLYTYVDLNRQRGFLGWPVSDQRERDGRISVAFQNGTLSFSEKDGVVVPKAEFMIIAPAEFAHALRPLIEHKQRTGMSTRLVTLEYIADRYKTTSRDLPEAVKRAIFDHRAQFGTKYVWLVGDITKMPTRYCLMSEEESFNPGS